MNLENKNITNNFFLINCIEFIKKVVFASFIFFLIINFKVDEYNIINEVKNYLIWFVNFFTGDFGTTIDDKKIIFFSDANAKWVEPIGLIYINTIITTIMSLILIFSVSSLFCIVEVILKKRVLIFIRNTLEWLSSIHIIIISIFTYKFFQYFNMDVPYFVGLCIITLSSNIFYDYFTNQKTNIIEVFAKDFVIAAKAWGDSSWKHARRSILINTIDQLFSIYIIIFTNTLIYEIITQSEGLGYLCWIYFQSSADEFMEFSVNQTQNFQGELFLSVCMFIIITIAFFNLLRSLIINYLIYLRR